MDLWIYHATTEATAAFDVLTTSLAPIMPVTHGPRDNRSLAAVDRADGGSLRSVGRSITPLAPVVPVTQPVGGSFPIAAIDRADLTSRLLPSQGISMPPPAHVVGLAELLFLDVDWALASVDSTLFHVHTVVDSFWGCPDF